jgi:hypothetical protein
MRTGGLTALKAKNLMREGKPGLKNDGGGLYLKDGSSWIYRYEGNDGKKHDMGLGSALDISLAEARELAAAARKFRREGKDPITERRASRAASAMTLTFGECGRHAASVARGMKTCRRRKPLDARMIGRQRVFQIKDGPKGTALENLKAAGAQQAHN